MTETPRITRKERAIAYRTKGHGGGPITRLMSPGHVGEMVKPFLFLDHFDFSGPSDGGQVHPLVTGMYSVHTSPKNLVIGESGIRDVASSMSLIPWRPLAASADSEHMQRVT